MNIIMNRAELVANKFLHKSATKDASSNNPYRVNGVQFTPVKSCTNDQWKRLPLVVQVCYTYTPDASGMHFLN